MPYKYYSGDWTVLITRGKGFKGGPHYGFFREAWRRDPRGNRKLCRQFTLFVNKDSDEAIVQLQIFPDGTIQSWAHEPCLVRVYRSRKLIVVGPFKIQRRAWEQPILRRVK